MGQSVQLGTYDTLDLIFIDNGVIAGDYFAQSLMIVA